MYQDPTKIRQHVVKIRLSDEEHRLLQALVDFTGEQKAAFIRRLVLDQAVSVLHGDESTLNDQPMRSPHAALLGVA